MNEIKKDIELVLSIIKDVKTDIINLSAQMAMRQSMPSTEYTDWNFTKNISKKDASNVLNRSSLADEQCRLWAIELRRIADKLYVIK